MSQIPPTKNPFEKDKPKGQDESFQGAIQKMVERMELEKQKRDLMKKYGAEWEYQPWKPGDYLPNPQQSPPQQNQFNPQAQAQAVTKDEARLSKFLGMPPTPFLTSWESTGPVMAHFGVNLLVQLGGDMKTVEWLAWVDWYDMEPGVGNTPLEAIVRCLDAIFVEDPEEVRSFLRSWGYPR